MIKRPRRLRVTETVRNMIAETRLSEDMFIYPYFVKPGKNIQEEIEAMPGIHRFSIDNLIKDVEKGLKAGVNKVLLFGVGENKSADASSAFHPHSVAADSVRELKKQFGADLHVTTDICLCAYTTHGHCGILKDDYVLNDPTLEVLAQMALAHAEAGADMVAPSDMMDGRVLAIRSALDSEGFVNTALMSYATKFASAYYGPFREAAGSAPGKGDRKSYQMDFRNPREALREARLDEAEGADIIMVKPALAYLDIIRLVRKNTTLPVACYNVSAEYSMVKAAAQSGYIDEQRIVMENMYAFARAGAGIIITYHARDIMENKWL
ncbi:MAG: porphobilinogen synthase [Bacteroidetes bacterium]|nr:MAG: porphobilinogen synthase [Bacteroidota bacterium]REK03473.1 MAG: porphobilinogen synthase [Bacteroidota bacterium]REK34778.1 MAG: porphobilinogen synthase [Bacteroidota bacterium]REK51343.1 MAG: porphobilinogen synthase [Bacteroidota bacterium]